MYFCWGSIKFLCLVNSLSHSESLLDGAADMNGGSSPGQHSPSSSMNHRLRPQLGSPVSSTSTAEVMLQRRGTGVCDSLTCSSEAVSTSSISSSSPSSLSHVLLGQYITIFASPQRLSRHLLFILIPLSCGVIV